MDGRSADAVVEGNTQKIQLRMKRGIKDKKTQIAANGTNQHEKGAIHRIAPFYH